MCPVCDMPDAALWLGHGCPQGTGVSPAGERSVPSVSLLEAQLVLASGCRSSLPDYAQLSELLYLWDSYSSSFIIFRAHGL